MKRLSGQPAVSQKPWTRFYSITASESESPLLKMGISTGIIRIAAIENGHIDRDTEDSIKLRLVAAVFKLRFDEQEV